MSRPTKLIPNITLALLAFSPLVQAGEFRPAGAGAVDGEYVVTLKSPPGAIAVSEFRTLASGLAGSYGGSLGQVCSESLGIFAVHLTEGQARRLAEDARVGWVEQNTWVISPEDLSVLGEEECVDYTFRASFGGGGGGFTQPIACPVLDPRAPLDPGDPPYDCQDNWGLDRIDQTDLPLDGEYHYDLAGEGVHAYILDSGIDVDHGEFTGRVGSGLNVAANPPNQNLQDCSIHSHGTHVAAIVGGTRYGVAKGVRLHPMKFVDYCPNPAQGGTHIDVCEAIDWIIQNHGTGDRIGPAVVSYSYNPGRPWPPNGPPEYMVTILEQLMGEEISFVQSAGNILGTGNACDYTFGGEPSLPEVIVAGGLDISEFGGADLTGRWLREGPGTPGGPTADPSYPVCQPGVFDPSSGTFLHDCRSNVGTCIDLWAPAGHIVSAGNDGGACRLSGTSMAAPHVTGAIALYLEQNPGASVAAVKQGILDLAAPDVLPEDTGTLYDIGANLGSPNLLLQIPGAMPPGPGPLFNDDFETGGISNWDGSFTPAGGTLQVTTEAAQEGVYGLEVSPTFASTFLFVSDNSPSNETEYGASFLLDLGQFGLATSSISLATWKDASDKAVLLLRLRFFNGSYQLRLGTYLDDLVTLAQTPWVDVPQSLNYVPVRVQFAAATAPGASDGYAKIWFATTLAGKVVGLDNDERSIDRAWIGLTGGDLSGGVSGSYAFDDYRSWRGPTPP